MIGDVYAGSGSQMFIPDPGVKKAQGSRIRNTAAMLEIFVTNTNYQLFNNNASLLLGLPNSYQLTKTNYCQA
jgi:hypothetical protein